MKFHNLEICNINSLYDEQTINFDGALSQTPLFLIMGPTGSGKTTILDCICLVLFGTTPRQKGVSNTSDIAEHIMSRGTGEASVTLEFSRRAEDGERLRYRAGWYCNRAHKKPSGNMQTPRRSLDRWSEASGTWESLTTTTTQKEYEPYFDEALADMTLEDFLRSVLLAQGAFTAFLEAKPDKKADILEKLTSTEQYMSIGGRAMQRWQEAKGSVQEIENKMEGVSPLADDEFASLEEERDALTKQADKKTAERDEAKAKLDWLEKLEALRERIGKAEATLDAARKEREEHAADFERLAVAKRAQPAAKVLAERDRLDSELADLREEVADRNEKLEDLRPKHKETIAQVKAAREVLGKAKTKRSEMSESIEEAKELYVTLKLETSAADEKKEAASKAKEELDTLEEQLAEEKTELNAAKEARDAAAETLEALSAYEGIGEEFAGLEADFSSLEAALKRVEEQSAKVDTLETEKAEASEALEDVNSKLAGEADALAPLEEAVEQAKVSLEAQLKGAEDAAERRRALREQIEAARTRKQAAETLAEHVESLGKTRSELSARREAVEDIEEDLSEANERADALRESVADAEESVKTRSEVVDAREDAAKFVRQRAQLEDGKECPVCGSTEHPWAARDDESDEVLGKLESAEEALREAEATLDTRKDSLDEVREVCARLEQKLENASERAEEASDAASDVARAVKSGLNACDAEASLDDLEDIDRTVGPLVERANERVGALVEAQDALEEAEKAHTQATDALAEAKSRGDDWREKKRALEQSIDALRTQLSSARDEELERRAKGFDEDAGALRERFAGVGIDVDLQVDGRKKKVAAFDAALRDAREQRDTRKAKTAALEELQEKVERREARIETLVEERLPDHRKSFEEAKKAATEATDKVDALKAKTESMLDGEKPADVEERLDKAVADAELAVEKVEATRDELKEQRTTLETELTGKEERRDTLKAERETADEALKQKLGELEMDDVDALRDAMVDDETMAQLDERVGEIKDALAGAKGTLKTARDELDEHRKARPETLEDDADAEQLAERVAALEDEKTELDQQLGARSEAIKTQKELREKHATLADELQERRVELRQWARIHELIGQNQGANFKRFAQGLNLERIVHKANNHLKQLHDRYRLVVVKDGEGHPQLEFEVVDTHVANAERAISTLSGGETFLVSLALALALADFRQVKMPVETLLLDEGFGTLDQQSLDDAVSTLKTLHTREKRQVGVISHVERLQEEIQHRVVVRKLSGGRSRIELETP